MRQVPRHRVVESACSRVGRAAQTGATFLSVFAYSLSSCSSHSSQHHLRDEFDIFSYSGSYRRSMLPIGHILRGALALSCNCEHDRAHRLTWQARFTDSVLNWANRSVRDLLERRSLTIAHCRISD